MRDHRVPTLNLAMEGVKEEGANSTTTSKENLDPLSYPGGPITRARVKKMKEAIMGLVQSHLINGQLMVNWSKSIHSQQQFSTYGVGILCI